MKVKRTLPSREKLSNPHKNKPFMKRLKDKGAVDLRNNRREIDMGGGYVKVEPIDKNKRFTQSGRET